MHLSGQELDMSSVGIYLQSERFWGKLWPALASKIGNNENEKYGGTIGEKVYIFKNCFNFKIKVA